MSFANFSWSYSPFKASKNWLIHAVVSSTKPSITLHTFKSSSGSMNVTPCPPSSSIFMMSALMYVQVDPEAFPPCPGPCRYLSALLVYPFLAVPITVLTWYTACSRNLVNNNC